MSEIEQLDFCDQSWNVLMKLLGKIIPVQKSTGKAARRYFGE